MDGVLGLIVIGLIAIPIIRWMVWAGRYKDLQSAIKSLETKQSDLSEQIAELKKLVEEKTEKGDIKKKVVSLKQAENDVHLVLGGHVGNNLGTRARYRLGIFPVIL